MSSKRRSGESSRHARFLVAILPLSEERKTYILRQRRLQAQQVPVGEDVSVEASLLQGFEGGVFISWPSWRWLRRTLRTNGGCYGLAGPRGSGKTWLMLAAIHNARVKRGVGLWYPSPSEYDPTAFLSSLSDNLGNEIERQYRRNRWWSPLVGRNAVILLSTIVGVYFLFAYLVNNLFRAGFFSVGAFDYLRYNSIVITVVLLALVGLLALAIFHTVRALVPEGRLVREATILRERIRYSATLKEGSELGGEAGKGVLGRFKSTRERQLVERPTTLSTLIYDFRELARRAAEVASGPVVVAIDELDKMSNPDLVRALLRDVKGIFEVPGVHYLVSVSNEAVQSLALGPILGRNEFSSSFYTVFEIPPITPDQSNELIRKRTESDGPLIEPDLGSALAVIAGGNPREILRLAELISNTPQATGCSSLVHALSTVMKAEAMELRREVIAFGSSGDKGSLTDAERVGVFRTLNDKNFSCAKFSQFANSVLLKSWTATWMGDKWETLFGENWRKLLVRLHIAGFLASGERAREADAADWSFILEGLQDAVNLASQSAAVAVVRLSELIPIDLPVMSGSNTHASRKGLWHLRVVTWPVRLRASDPDRVD